MNLATLLELRNDLQSDDLEKEQAENSLAEFIRQAWHVVDGAEYTHGWHIDAICDHLEATVTGKIKNLLMNIPPRHAKSLIVCVFFPAWVWIKHPEKKFVFTSYSREFSFRDSLKCRRLIQSPWFQKRWGENFQLTKDQSTKGRFDNTRGGFRFATSVDAGATGEGGDFIVVDDAHSTNEAESDAVRESTLTWWDETMGSRANDARTCVRIAIGQRQHHLDLYGHLLKKGTYVHVCLPVEYEGDQSETIIGFKDPRTEDKELLWPERMPREIIEAIKIDMGSYAYAGQYLQRPSQREGAIIKVDWLSKRFRLMRDNQGRLNISEFRERYQSWDTAFKEGEENDYSVCTMWGVKDDGYYLVAVIKMRCDFPTLEQRAIELGAYFRPNRIFIEDKASGQSLIQALQRKTKLPIKAVKVDRDKIARVNAVSGYFESGRIILPEGEEWLNDYITEMTTFPAAPHDDCVDSTSQFLLEVALKSESRVQIHKPSLIGR